MNQSQRKRVYLKKKEPLHIFSVATPGNAKIFLEDGCVRISKKQYDAYPRKGLQ